jgi:hypothetical protein
VALALVPDDWTSGEDFPEDTSAGLRWVKSWLADNGLDADDGRRELVRTPPANFKRLLRSAEEHRQARAQHETIYTALLRDAHRRGEITAAQLGENVVAFGAA